jgi:hypothetical protein
MFWVLEQKEFEALSFYGFKCCLTLFKMYLVDVIY